MKYIMGLLFAVAMMACQVVYYPSRVMAPKDPHLETLHFSVWIDKDFTSQERFQIEEGLGDWNWALNGYIVFKVVDDSVTVTDGLIDRVRQEHLSVLFIQQQHNRAADKALNNEGIDTIAFADNIPGNFVTIFSDRFSHVDGRQITAHELGHILGAQHNNSPHSLMNAHGFVMQNPCIDAETMKEVVDYHQWMFLKYTNFCLVRD